MQRIFNLGTLFLLVAVLASCGSSDKEKFAKSPVDQLLKKYDKEKPLSLILYDIELDEGFFSDTYKHKYKVVREKPEKTTDSLGNEITIGKPYETLTDWYEVSEGFFNENANNMGMEVAYRDENGKLNKVPAPPGYNRYVGNKQYGQWSTGSNGNSFWAFYGQYMFMSSMFNLMSPIPRHGYNSYRTQYYGKKPYYGSTKTGGTKYGTFGSNSFAKGSRAPSVSNKSSSFQNRVSSTVSRSGNSAAAKSASGFKSRVNSSTSRSSRSSGRSGSSSRGGK
jgi:hypothetical protein